MSYLALLPDLTFLVCDTLEEAYRLAATRRLCSYDMISWKVLGTNPDLHKEKLRLLAGQYSDAALWVPWVGEWAAEPHGSDPTFYGTERELVEANRQRRSAQEVDGEMFIRQAMADYLRMEDRVSACEKENAELRKNLRTQATRNTGLQRQNQEAMEENNALKSGSVKSGSEMMTTEEAQLRLHKKVSHAEQMLLAIAQRLATNVPIQTTKGAVDALFDTAMIRIVLPYVVG